MAYDPIVYEASRLGFIAELKDGRLRLETLDGHAIVGDGAPVSLEAAAGSYTVKSPIGFLETGNPRVAVAAAYAFYAGMRFNRLASKVRVLGGILNTTPVGVECSRWAQRLSGLEGRTACILAILVAAAFRAYEVVDPEGEWRHTPWYRAAAMINEGMERLGDESRLADRIVEVLRKTGPGWLHAFPLLSIAASISGHPRLDYQQALAHSMYHASISSVEAPGPIEALYAAQSSWASGKRLATRLILAQGLVLAASTPATLPLAAGQGEATLYIDRIALNRALSLGRMAWQTYESARLQGLPAALYMLGSNPILGTAGLDGVAGEYCVKPRLSLPVAGLIPGDVVDCATVKPPTAHNGPRGGR